jgi:hypothetical protein
MAAPLLPLVGLGMLFNAGFSLFGASKEAEAIEAQAAFNRWQSDQNAAIADISAEQSIFQGEEAVSQVRTEGDKILGAQRAGYAAQGVKVDTGSAADVATETRFNINKDIITLRNNAKKAAWGYKVEARNHRTAGKYGQQAAKNAANNTILTGGLKAFSQGLEGAGRLYYGMKNYGPEPTTTIGSGPYGWSGGLM